MSELGRLLAEARAAKELSLADVEAAIRVRQRYLQAFESGQFDLLPRGPVARGFLRIYGRFLGLDENELLRRFAEESGEPLVEVPLAEPGKPRLVDYRPVEVALMDGRPRMRWLSWAFIIAAVVIALLGVGIWFSRTRDWRPWPVFGPAPRPTATATEMSFLPTAPPLLPSPTPTSPPPPTAVPPTPTSDLLPLPTPSLPPSPTPTPRPTATPQPGPAISLSVRITNRAWVRVVADGAVVTEENLEPGQTRTWEASQSILIRTGNAGGVNLALNGQEYGAMGALGQVVERSWVAEGDRLVEIPVGTSTVPPRRTLTPTPAG